MMSVRCVFDFVAHNEREKNKRSFTFYDTFVSLHYSSWQVFQSSGG